MEQEYYWSSENPKHKNYRHHTGFIEHPFDARWYIRTIVVADDETGDLEIMSDIVPRGMLQVWLDQDQAPHDPLDKASFIKLLSCKPKIMTDLEKYK